MKKIAWAAVIVGGIADMILSNLFAIPVAIYMMLNFGIAKLPASQITNGYLAALHANPGLYTTAVLCGCLASLCAGIIAALIAKHDRVLNGALSSWACVGIDIYGLLTHTSTDGLALQILLMPAAPLLGAIGGLLVVRLRRGRSAALA